MPDKNNNSIPSANICNADNSNPFLLSTRLRKYYDFSGREDDLIDSGQLLAERINHRRGASSHPGRSVRAGQIDAIGLIDEIFHYLSNSYHQTIDRELSLGVTEALEEKLGRESLRKLQDNFIDRLPGLEIDPDMVSDPGRTEGSRAEDRSGVLVAAEMMMLDLANRNPAFQPLAELFDDNKIKETTYYPELLTCLRDYYRDQPSFGPEEQPLPEFLQAPILFSPDSLSGQLMYIRENWSELLSPELLQSVLLTQDVINEEEKLRLAGSGPVAGPVWTDSAGGGGLVDEYRDGYGSREAFENFSPDLDWMPRVVLMVKNSYVWLDQLSRRYRRRISQLDQIPDEELDRMARWGFTGFWLIGIWERSPASREIKRRCGNPEADASAYSLYDYVISADLGGQSALNNLKHRAWKRGIRLSSDMVPNHVGLYSKWVIEHPHWFVQSSRSPFPGYTFNGPDLSKDSRVEIYLEDGYWRRSDAAVVFKRVDRTTGEVCYLYHGNDGTSMPWNDTAQLDFLKSEVREAVIQTILHVARSFPIIRFDAAMVLTKQHFQRLWYPPPGEGGAIPSRSGRGVSTDEFNRLFPREFWREVVNRVAREIPETLLLAEAFWMLEGYFVRTLGMHRVYNSAFMNMLKMEMNDQYRQVIKEILEFDPGILKRFVNFMSNPDEAPAVAQFGKGDKYFGVCTMMATMPGLPLFGHGQIEGLTEKYGMEYHKAYWDEPIDEYLVKRHEKEIFPLMKKRHLFSDVANFYLYDFYMENGSVNEDVFAYSNRYENERSLIVYNNRFCNTSGWIRLSASRVEKGRGGRNNLVRVDISRGLGLRMADNDYTIFKDLRSGLEYIRSSLEIREKGFYMMLRAYQTHVFGDIREVRDDEKGFLARLCDSLNGRGVDNINDALKKVYFAPLYQAFQAIFNGKVFRRLLVLPSETDSIEALFGVVAEMIETGLKKLLEESLALRGRPRDVTGLIDRQLKYDSAIALLVPESRLPGWISSRYSRPTMKYLASRIPVQFDDNQAFFRIILTWSILRTVGEAIGSARRPAHGNLWMREWFMGEQVMNFFQELGCDWSSARRDFSLVSIILRHVHRMREVKTRNHLYRLEPIFKDSEVRRFLLYNWENRTLWFNRERLEELLYWLVSVATIIRSVDNWELPLPETAGTLDEPPAVEDLFTVESPPRVKGLVYYRAAGTIMDLATRSGYRVKEFRKLLAQEPRKRRRRGKKGSANNVKKNPKSKNVPKIIPETTK